MQVSDVNINCIHEQYIKRCYELAVSAANHHIKHKLMFRIIKRVIKN